MRGISLVEAIVALAILAVVMAATLVLVPSSMLGVHRAHGTLQADGLAQSLIEQKRAAGFSRLVVGSREEPAPVKTRENIELHPVVEVFAVGEVPQERVRELRVTVSWTARNKPHQVVHSVLMAAVKS